ncbi:MAG: 4-(cytidine 5'-diphospho)-2-C-methyl-D-erythritol kinase [Phycisphaeraceae bacterium]
MPIRFQDDTLVIDCPAKLNLTLAVAPPRGDGLHPIASLMVALGFGDTLTLRPLAAGPSRFTRRFAEDAPKPQPIDWPVERDLAYRAHALVEEEVGDALPVQCVIDKRIPAGAGLGGGSSNAAAMIVGLYTLFDLPIDDDDRILDIAQKLGADVCFLVEALLGQPAALVTGVGEVIEPIDIAERFDLVLVFPDGVCPTAEVYAAFDAGLPAGATADLDACVAGWAEAESMPAAHNDLQRAAESVCPAIAKARGTLEAMGLSPRLTGSGSALFVLADDAEGARLIADHARAAGLAAAATGYDDVDILA